MTIAKENLEMFKNNEDKMKDENINKNKSKNTHTLIIILTICLALSLAISIGFPLLLKDKYIEAFEQIQFGAAAPFVGWLILELVFVLTTIGLLILIIHLWPKNKTNQTNRNKTNEKA